MNDNVQSMNRKMLDLAKEVVLQGLTDSFISWNRLTPEAGILDVGVNQFADEAIEADRASERAMILAAKESDLSTRWISEEYGQMDINYVSAKNETAAITAVADGIDGSSNAVSNWSRGNYGGIFSELQGDDPVYRDYLAAGIVMFTSHELLYTTQAGAIFKRDLLSGKEDIVPTISDATLTFDSIIFAEFNRVPREHALYEYFELNSDLAEQLIGAGYSPKRSGSTASNIADIVLGRAVADISATRKGNLELVAEYALIREAGGVVYALEKDASQCAWQIVDLADKKFFSYGQTTHIPILAAANEKIANQLIQLLNK